MDNKRLKLGYGGGAIADYPWHLSGDHNWTSSDDRDAENTIVEARRLGITFIDTARRYGGGHSEMLIGRILRSNYFPIPETVVVSKMALTSLVQFQSDYFKTLDTLGAYLKGVLIHNPDFSNQRLLHEAVQWLLRLELEYAGISTEPTRDAAYWFRVYYASGLNMVQFPFSVYDRRAESEMLPWMANYSGLVKVANRVLGGPRYGESKLKSYDVSNCLSFIRSHVGFVDYALVGTTNCIHLRECAMMVSDMNEKEASPYGGF